MGLASFNRARRSRKEVEKLEAERFEQNNKARWAAHHAREKRPEADDKVVDKVRKAEQEASEEIGRKTVQGIEDGEKGGIIDGPLRRDHAAEIAGRAVEDAQGVPKKPTELIDERIPDSTVNEKLADHTQVDREGPSAALVRDAQVEAAPEADKESVKKQLEADASRTEDIRKEAVEKRDARIAEQAKQESELPAAGKSAGAGKTESSSSAKQAESKPETKTPAKK